MISATKEPTRAMMRQTQKHSLGNEQPEGKITIQHHGRENKNDKNDENVKGRKWNNTFEYLFARETAQKDMMTKGSKKIKKEGKPRQDKHQGRHAEESLIPGKLEGVGNCVGKLNSWTPLVNFSLNRLSFFAWKEWCLVSTLTMFGLVAENSPGDRQNTIGEHAASGAHVIPPRLAPGRVNQREKASCALTWLTCNHLGEMLVDWRFSVGLSSSAW